MMISKKEPQRAYVWIWLPEATTPVVAGVLFLQNNQFIFTYGQSYLRRENAIALSEKELPLKSGEIKPLLGLSMANCLRDASPDAWGRRVIAYRQLGSSQVELDELTYFLESGSDRIGALDFQHSATQYMARHSSQCTLTELLESAHRVEAGIPLSPVLDQALLHGTSLGGARPKAIIDDGNHKYIAKFSSSTDIFNVVKFEFVAMRLALLCGLNVAHVKLQKVLNKDVLLVERFDHIKQNNQWTRKLMQSALTLLELNEMMARYASYQDFAEIIRLRFQEPTLTLRELFGRLVFNILCGNTDDHARNHAAFWDGSRFILTPAYDICPQGRSGNEASQAMLIYGNNRKSQLVTCVQAASSFGLSAADAIALIQKFIFTIRSQKEEVSRLADLSEAESLYLWGRQFFNPYSLEGFDDLTL